MATFTNLDTIHRATTGAVAPATWGDAVNDDMNVLNTSLRWLSGASKNWSSAAFIVADTVSFTAASGGTVITFGTAFTTSSLVVCSMKSSASATSITADVFTATGFTVKVWNGSTQVTSGTFYVFYIAIGI